MIITFTADKDKQINAEELLAAAHAALDKTNPFYLGNLQWDPETGLVVKLLNSVRMKIEVQLQVIDPAKKGAAIVDGERQKAASISANARFVSRLHETHPTAVVQVGNIFYQAKVPYPSKRPTVAVPAGSAPVNPSITPPGTSHAANLPASLGAPVQKEPVREAPEWTPGSNPGRVPTDAEIEAYYDKYYAGGM